MFTRVKLNFVIFDSPPHVIVNMQFIYIYIYIYKIRLYYTNLPLLLPKKKKKTKTIVPDLFVQTFFNYFLLKLLYPIIFFKIRILVTNFNLNSQLKLHFYLPIITYYLKFVKQISLFFFFSFFLIPKNKIKTFFDRIQNSRVLNILILSHLKPRCSLLLVTTIITRGFESYKIYIEKNIFDMASRKIYHNA